MNYKLAGYTGNMENYYNTQITDQDLEENKTYAQQEKIRKTKLAISTFLALLGISILGLQAAPLVSSYLKGKVLENQVISIKDPAPSYEINPSDNDLPYYDPGMSYFQNLLQHINPGANVAGASTGPNTTQPSNFKVDESYSSPMKISIPSVEIKSITITPNVDSFAEETYNEALKSGVAHFKGTPLPGDGGNSFIYGHSAPESFFSNHQDDPETIFTRLEDVEVADKITIEKDGKSLKYTVIKKKITNPDDFDVLSGIPGKETITLMSCWPAGVGSQRTIVVAEKI